MKDNRQNNMDSTDMDNLQMSNGNKRVVKIQDVKPGQLFKIYSEYDKHWGQVIYTRKEEEGSKGYGVVPIDKRLYSFTVLSDTEVQLIDDELQQSLDEVNCTGKCLEEDIKQQYTDSLPHTYNLRSKEQAETNWLSGSLLDVKVTEKCQQKELSAQLLENIAKDAEETQRLIDEARLSGKVGNGIIDPIRDMILDKPTAVDTSIIQQWIEVEKGGPDMAELNKKLEEMGRAKLEELNRTGKTTWTTSQSTKEIVNEVKKEAKLDQWRTDSILSTWDMSVSSDEYTKWAESELAKIKISDEELQKGFEDMLTSDTEIWRFRGGDSAPERIVPGTKEWWDSLDKIQTMKAGERMKMQQEIEEQLKRIRTEGINSDQTEEEKGVFAYYDTIVENRMIEELEEKLKQLTDPDKAIDTQIYNSLEEIYKDMLPSGMTMEALYEVVKKAQEKLQKTIDNGMYLQKGEL